MAKDSIFSTSCDLFFFVSIELVTMCIHLEDNLIQYQGIPTFFVDHKALINSKII